MNPLISVILPVYNRERYVSEAVKSILEQTVGNFELIIINDGSTDATKEKIKRIKDSRIKIFSQKEKKGVSVSRNLGLSKAKGEFIAFMDSDDISDPERFEEQLKVFRNKPHVDVCGTWIQVKDCTKLIRFKEYHEEIIVQMFMRCPISIGTVMYRRDPLKNVLFDLNLLHGEDYDFWSRVAWKVTFYNIQKPLLFYRKHPGQISRLFKEEQIKLDVDLRLKLFREFNYPTDPFSESILTNIFLFKSFFSIKEFSLFLNWLDYVDQANDELNIYPKKEFLHLTKQIRKDLIKKIFLKRSDIGITRKWRFFALRELKAREILMIAKMKFNEYSNILSK